MSYEEKGTWSFLVVAVVAYGVYLWLVLPQLLGGTPVERVDYVIPMLWTIGGAIVPVSVRYHIASSVTTESTGHPCSRKSGISSRMALGSITAPLRICAPTNEPFSTIPISISPPK